MSKEEPVPSPFWSKDENEEFLEEIDKVCKKYGFNQYFIAFGQDDKKNDETSWQASSKEISEGLIEFLGLCQDYAQEQIDDFLN